MVVVLHEFNHPMETARGRYFINDREIKDMKDFDGSFLEKGRNIYEVMRVIDGVILFLGDHLDRLSNSLQESDLEPLTGSSEIKKLLVGLVHANHLLEGNIKLVFHYGEKEPERSFNAYLIPFTYPSKEDYRQGINAGIFEYTRPSPGIKNWLGDFRDRVTFLKKKNSWYEVILRNEAGLITEGSQSNLFLIKQDKIYTAPIHLVLGGITRKKIFDICNSKNILIEEAEFNSTFLYSADAVFLTGTSPKVLPLRHIDERTFTVDHPLLKTLIKEYDEKITGYIKVNRDAI